MSTTDTDTDTDDERTKYARPSAANSNTKRWHYDPDCTRFYRDSPVREVDERYIEWHDLDECSRCGDAPKPSAKQSWNEQPCPMCGEGTKRLGHHLSNECEATQ